MSLNAQEGTTKKGGQTPQKPVVTQLASPDRAPRPKDISKLPFLNPDPLMWWSGPKNIVWVKIDGENSWALLDSGLTIYAVTPEFLEAHSLDVGPLSDLANSTLGENGFRGVFYWLLDYTIINIQVEGVWGYNEDQVALVIQDSTIFGSEYWLIWVHQT